jgi:outer membrane cobalamin receptor
MKWLNLYRICILVFIVLVPALRAQNIKGTVFSLDGSGNKAPLEGANIYFLGSKKATISSISGSFSIRKEQNDSLLAVSFVGFIPDTITVVRTDTLKEVEFYLKEGIQLQEVVVNGTQAGTFFSRTDVLKTEHISNVGLMKMACCNLAESFENSATITSTHTDAVSGAKQIQLLGLSGVYSQVLAENIPIIRGLANSFGWNYVPGSWLESIQISKGSSSVANGYEAITGQINLEFKKPDKVEGFYAELYADEHERYELNVTGARKVSENLWSNLLVNASDATWSTLFGKYYHDRNRDHFMDMPKTKQINAYNRWLYISPSKRLQSRTGIQFIYEDRIGGQSPLCHKADVYYTTDVVNQNFYVYNKTGISVGSRPGQSIGIINDFTNYKLESYFGSDKTCKIFNGYQQSFKSSVLFNSFIGNTNHQFSTGVSLILDNYQSLFRDKLPENNTPLTSLNRKEIVPGFFGQYTYAGQKFTWILGLREDYNSKYGWLFTPRTNLRYGINEFLILRFSAGCGYHAPNVITDNFGLMASTRNFNVETIQSLKIEKAWNYGGNATFYIPIWDKRKLTLSLDYFRTNFDNHVIVDLDRDKNSVFYYNSTARNFTNVWQSDLSFSVFNGFDVFAAFRYNSSWITLSEDNSNYLMETPLILHYRGLVNLSYATKFRKWVFDFTMQANGPSRIPNTTGYSGNIIESPAYPVFFAQITKNAKRLDIYLGAENIFDYRQPHPIINASDPFVKGFDASEIWGPLMGRKIYAGIRLRFGKIY